MEKRSFNSNFSMIYPSRKQQESRAHILESASIERASSARRERDLVRVDDNQPCWNMIRNYILLHRISSVILDPMLSKMDETVESICGMWVVSSSSPVYLGYILIILVYPGSRSKSLKFILNIFTWALSIRELRGRERAKLLLTGAYT